MGTWKIGPIPLLVLSIPIMIILSGIGWILPMEICLGSYTEHVVTREAPAGYYRIAQAVSDYPGIVVQNGSSYDIMSSLSLPASKSLYLGPGENLQFARGAYMNLSAPPFFEGSEEPLKFSPMKNGTFWGGINIYEADPTTIPIFHRVSISGAKIGIRTSGGADIEVTGSSFQNCERSGIEAFGPTSAGTSVTIEDTSFTSCGNYGIHFSEISSALIVNVSAFECITGIRAFKSQLLLEDSNLLDSFALGLSLVNSEATISRTVVNETEGRSTTATHQIISLNSSLILEDSWIDGGKQCILLQQGSDMEMKGSTVMGGFTDCIQAIGSSIIMNDSRISDAVESAVHMVDSTLWGKDLDLDDNGKGTGDVVYSTLYMDRSQAHLESSSVTGSGDAHFHLNSSRISIANSTQGNFGNYPIILQSSSSADYINSRPPSDARFKDILSFTRYSITPMVSTTSYTTGGPLENVQVDIEDREGTLIGSSLTGSDGNAGPFLLNVYTNTSSGTINRLPFRILASLKDHEVSVLDMDTPQIEMEMVLFPPNSPPTLNLVSPVNGTIVDGNVVVQGYISDDLDIFKLRYRVDQSSYFTMDLGSVGENGYFEISLDPGTLSKGEHQLWIHAFDGSHLSTPEIRRVISNTSGLDDSDSDGIPDILEDLNGNGEVDENETDPEDPDTDDDGLLDGIELDDSDGFTTDPLKADTDGDFILDGTEDANGNGRLDENETDPNNSDTDQDGRSDLDDLYPLDPERWEDPDEGNEGSSIILVLVVIIFVLVLILGYALYQRLSIPGGSTKEDIPENGDPSNYRRRGRGPNRE